jgi:hypothetical protein
MIFSTRYRIALAVACVALTGSLAFLQTPKPDPLQALRAGFLNPPDEAKPMVRWWWFGAAVVKPEILRELEQMKADGIGGAELAFVYPEVLDDPAKNLKNLPFLSPEMLDAVNYAQTEGRRLGLRIDVTLCSGWPYGGPATTLEQATTRLKTVEVPLAANAASVATPKLGEGETLLGAAIVNGTPNPPPIRRGPPGQAPPPNTWDAATAKSFTPSGAMTSVAPEDKSRVALFFIQSHTKQEVKRAAVGAEGYVLDPFSRQAVKTHLDKVGEPLVKAFGNTPPYAIFSDSLEAYGADWTPELPAEFKKRRGYDLMAHLAELVGGGSAPADTVRHDYGRTLTELVNENYLTQINDWANAHGTKFRSQTYGEPAVNFSSQNLVALAEGEGPQWRAFSTLRWATSANHVFGHNVTSGETFTWLHSPVFRATPLDMKTEADIDFIMGENQLIYHGWPYSPPDHEVPEPGWSLYAAASFNNHNPWHPVEPAVNKYIARLSFLMRQGQPANQVAILLPEDDAWASFSPGHTTMTGALARLITPELMAAILSAGYNVDFIDAAAIDKVGFGNHQVVVIPPTDRIPLETLRKLDQWVTKGGGKAIAVGRAPSMDADGKTSPELTKLLGMLPFVPDNENLARALKEETKPDLQLANADDATKSAIGFVHRKLPAADLYFVVNTSNHAVKTTATFATAYRGGEDLNPDTGAARGDEVDPRDWPLQLAPYESRAIVFHEGTGAWTGSKGLDRAPVDLSGDWKVTFVATGRTQTEATLTDWTADPETLHYSGEAVYSRDFNDDFGGTPMALEVDGGVALPGSPGSPPEHALMPNGLPDPRVTRPGPGMHAYYDPPVREGALVFINGKEAGALWHPPYRLDVSKLLKPGQNHIEIRVYNTALNAWSAEPPHDYKPLIQKYGDRFQMQDLDKVQPVSSGLLGTIKLVEMEPGK